MLASPNLRGVPSAAGSTGSSAAAGRVLLLPLPAAAHRAAKRAAEGLQDLPSPPDCIWVEVKDGDGRGARF